MFCRNCSLEVCPCKSPLKVGLVLMDGVGIGFPMFVLFMFVHCLCCWGGCLRCGFGMEFDVGLELQV